jgi:hypothetical protein
LGSAISPCRAYVDLLLYDEQQFLEKVRGLLADFPHLVIGKEFRHQGQQFLVGDPGAPAFAEQLQSMHDVGAHAEIAQVLEGLDPEDLNFDLSGLLARSLMNTDQEAKSIEVLMAWQEQGKADALWNVRMGTALFYSGREDEADSYLERAIELGFGQPDIFDMLESAKAKSHRAKQQQWKNEQLDEKPKRGLFRRKG